MQYEVKKIIYENVVENPDNTATQDILVTSGIVGDTYDFNRWDNMKSTYSMTLTGEQIKAQILLEAQNLVATKYPNT